MADVHPLHHYRHGCRCFTCIDTNRVWEAMAARKKRRGYLYLCHAPNGENAIERRYPQVVLEWIRHQGKNE